MSMAKLWLRVHKEKAEDSTASLFHVLPFFLAAASSNQPSSSAESQPCFFFNKVFRFHRQLEDGPLAQLEVRNPLVESRLPKKAV